MSSKDDKTDDGIPVDVTHVCEHGLTTLEPDENGVRRSGRYPRLKDGQAAPLGSDTFSFEQQRDGRVIKRVVHRGHKGPSRANSAAYREGYDGVFGKRSVAQA